MKRTQSSPLLALMVILFLGAVRDRVRGAEWSEPGRNPLKLTLGIDPAGPPAGAPNFHYVHRMFQGMPSLLSPPDFLSDEIRGIHRSIATGHSRRFCGGNPEAIRTNLERLLSSTPIETPTRAHRERN